MAIHKFEDIHSMNMWIASSFLLAMTYPPLLFSHPLFFLLTSVF